MVCSSASYPLMTWPAGIDSDNHSKLHAAFCILSLYIKSVFLNTDDCARKSNLVTVYTHV